PELELAGLLVEDRDAGHIRGQQVGRELDALERAAERAGDRLGEHRLASARHIFQQHMALAKQRDQHQFDRLALANDHFLNIDDDSVGNLFDVLHSDALFSMYADTLRQYTTPRGMNQDTTFSAYPCRDLW